MIDGSQLKCAVSIIDYIETFIAHSKMLKNHQRCKAMMQNESKSFNQSNDTILVLARSKRMQTFSSTWFCLFIHLNTAYYCDAECIFICFTNNSLCDAFAQVLHIVDAAIVRNQKGKETF